MLRLLRDGANVILTTRFPNAAAARFNDDADSPAWRDRLRIYGLDLRNLPVVEEFACHLLQSEPAIDIIIHNAAQTIKRPPGFYAELVAQEQNPRATVPIEARRMVVHEAPATLAIADSTDLLPGAVTVKSSALAEIRDILPADALHDNEERADSRDVNSWLLRLDEVPTQELLEVQLVNSIAPFVLNSRLKPLLARSPFARRFIVNVSAMEGQFGRHKTVYHPHTNMAKAALNMMTHTSGADYAKDGIFMNSVDTGWVTDEIPRPSGSASRRSAASSLPSTSSTAWPASTIPSPRESTRKKSRSGGSSSKTTGFAGGSASSHDPKPIADPSSLLNSSDTTVSRGYPFFVVAILVDVDLRFLYTSHMQERY